MAKNESVARNNDEVSKSVSESSDTEEAVVAVTPEVCIDHDDKTYFIAIELPGVRKEHIDLSVSEQSLCIQAARRDEALVYLGCFGLVHAVDENKAKAKFDSGLLRIEIPFRSPLTGKRVVIE